MGGATLGRSPVSACRLKAWTVEGLRLGASPAVLASPCRLLPPPRRRPPPSGGEGSLSAVALHCAEWQAVAVAVGCPQAHCTRCGQMRQRAMSQLRCPPPSCGASIGITALHLAPAGGVGGTGTSGQAAATAAATGPELHLFSVGSSRLAAFDVRTGRKVGSPGWALPCA